MSHALCLPLLSRLRERTRSLHEHLEAIVNLEALTDSRERYADCLKAFYGIWKPIEDLLGESPIAGDARLDLPKRLRASRIPEDLIMMDIHVEAHSFSKANLSWEALDHGEAAGVLYVMEGSTLGGKQIAAELKRKLGIEPHSGGSFFHGHGEATGLMWKQFLEWMEQVEKEHPSVLDAAPKAAEGCFLQLCDWFEAQQP